MASNDASSPCANLPSSTSSDRYPDGAFRLHPAQSVAVGPCSDQPTNWPVPEAASFSVAHALKAMAWRPNAANH